MILKQQHPKCSFYVGLASRNVGRFCASGLLVRNVSGGDMLYIFKLPKRATTCWHDAHTAVLRRVVFGLRVAHINVDRVWREQAYSNSLFQG